MSTLLTSETPPLFTCLSSLLPLHSEREVSDTLEPHVSFTCNSPLLPLNSELEVSDTLEPQFSFTCISPLLPLNSEPEVSDTQPLVSNLNPEAAEFTPGQILVDHPDHLFVEKQINLHVQVRESGVPNCQGLRIPVDTKINIAGMRELAHDYEDQEALDFLEFGFPINFEGPDSLLTGTRPGNHKGARDFPDAVSKYLDKECALAATMGPFEENPFPNSPIAVSPLNTVPKDTPGERRIILDLSFPPQSGVNEGIPSDTFLGKLYKLSLPGVYEFIEAIHRHGPGCFLYKRDLSRAFRQFMADPADWNKLGFEWQGKLFFDRALAMGLRTACIGCQRATNVIKFIAEKEGCDISNYLDDFGGADEPVQAWLAFNYLGWLLKFLNIDESVAKACEPSTAMVHLGILFDTIKMTMEVTPERVADILRELGVWREKHAASRKELQSLLGKLLFISKCVRQSRVFLSRLLNLLRGTPARGSILISEEARADIKWFATFLPTFNGVSLIPDSNWSEPDAILASDACLVGCGATCGQQCFSKPFLAEVLALDLHISALELLAVMVAVRVWASVLGRRKLVVFCDNEATVITINSGKSRDRFMQHCLRELCFIASHASLQIKAVHIPGVDNRLPDLLSRWPLDSSARKRFLELTREAPMDLVSVSDSCFAFSHDWSFSSAARVLSA